ncbi:MAG: hypothetical protein HYX52_07590 [Chloroflexi bacterium]|nr:hypothetical protein [Chloroflexota bacterium]
MSPLSRRRWRILCSMESSVPEPPKGSVDLTLIRAALQRTPAERFRQGVTLSRFARRLRAARRIARLRPASSTPK